ERRLEVREGGAPDGAERFEHALEVLACEEPRLGDVDVHRQIEQPRQNPDDVRDVTDAGGDLLQPRGSEPERVVAPDDRSHAGASDDVDGNPLALQHVEDPDVREPPGGAASESEPDAPVSEMAREAAENTTAAGILDRKRDDIVPGQRGTAAGAPVVDEHDATRSGIALGQLTIIEANEDRVR